MPTLLQVTIKTPECLLEPLEPDIADSRHVAEFGHVAVGPVVLDALETGPAESG